MDLLLMDSLCDEVKNRVTNALGDKKKYWEKKKKSIGINNPEGYNITYHPKGTEIYSVYCLPWRFYFSSCLQLSLRRCIGVYNTVR